MYPHRIRLRGPWDCQPLARTQLHSDGLIETLPGPVPPACVMTLPCRWREGGLGDFNGRVRYRRHFSWPGRLDPHERLWLTCAGADYFANFRLNGVLIGAHASAFVPFEADVTTVVQRRNELLVEVDLPALTVAGADAQRMIRGSQWCPPASGGLWGTVAVEVRHQVYLRHLRLWASFADGGTLLHVVGEVVGPGDRPLELYVLLDDRTLLYEQVETHPEGMAFELAIEVADVERWWPAGLGIQRLYEVRVELTDAANRVYETRQLFGFREVRQNERESDILVNGQALASANVQEADLYELTVLLEQLEEASKHGRPVWLRLPFAGGYSTDIAFRADAVRQVESIVRRLQAHPCLVGWTCHRDPRAHDAELDEAILHAVTSLDPLRPTWRS